jgi:hypothetical protein
MTSQRTPSDAWNFHDIHYACSNGLPLSMRPAFAGEPEALGVELASRTDENQILYIILRVAEDGLSLEKIPVWLEPVEFWRVPDIAALIKTIESLAAHGATEISADEARLYFGKTGGNA